MVRAPERLRRRDKFDGNFRNERLQPFRAVLHACLLGNHVPEQDERFVFSGTDRVLRVFDEFSFTRFAHNQHIDIGTR
jgi:hypothetical protein